MGSLANLDIIYNSYGGVDIVAEIILPNEPPLILGELQTISYSTHRENVPVRFTGHVNPVGFVKGPRCLPSTEKVLVKDKGLISIADVKPYDYVQSSSNTFDLVLGSYYQGQKQCYQLKLDNGYALKASFDHPISTQRGWVEMQYLKPKLDKVLVAAQSPSPEEEYPISDDMLKMIAFLIGDGSTHIYHKRDSDSKEHRISLAIGNEELSTIGDESAHILQNLEVSYKDVPHKEGAVTDRHINICLDGFGQTHWGSRRYSELHYKLIEFDLYGRYSHTKIIPQQFLAHLNKRQIKVFLRFLFSTDGSYSISKDFKYIEAKYVSTSEELVDGIRILLSKLGITTLKSVDHRVGKIGGRPNIISRHDLYTLVISNSFDLLKFISRVGIFGKDDRIQPHIKLLRSRMCDDSLPIAAKDFYKLSHEAIQQEGLEVRDFKGFNIFNYGLKKITPKKALRLAYAINNLEFINFTNSLVDQLLDSMNDYIYPKVISVEPIGVLSVYDLEVENRHSFIANHIKVHNTIAGSLIFTVFDHYAFYRLRRFQVATTFGLYPLADMLPAFDVVLSFANEYGSISKMRIYGITIVDEGQTMSVDDLITEQTYCVDDKTEALTQDGWKAYNRLSSDDMVLTINPLTKIIEWQPVLSVNIFSYNGPMIEWENYRGFKALTTPNHRWLTTSQYQVTKNGFVNANTQFKETKELAGKYNHIITSGGIPLCFAENPTFADEMVELIGWTVTEGTICKSPKGTPYAVTIPQSIKANPDHVESIRKLSKFFALQGASCSESSVTPKDCIVFYFGKGIAKLLISLVTLEKTLTPQFLTALTYKQALMLMETLIDGDGHRSVLREENSQVSTSTFIQNSGARVDSFQMLAAMVGKRTKVHKKTGSDCTSTTVYNSNIVFAYNLKDKIVEYKGIVWCPTTAAGTWLARKDGGTFWTGNSFMARGIYPLMTQKMEDARLVNTTQSPTTNFVLSTTGLRFV